MLDTLITSKTRIKLLLKFFLNSNTQGYLRNLESEFGESTNAIRLELNKFEKANMLESQMDGNKKVFRANTKHPLFPEIQTIVRKYIGIDRIVDHIVSKVGDLQCACLIGEYARGKDTGIMEVLLVGSDLNQLYLQNLGRKVEEMINRKVCFSTVDINDYEKKSYSELDCIILWEKES